MTIITMILEPRTTIALTFNICKHAHVNKRKWSTYTWAEQQTILHDLLAEYTHTIGAEVDYKKYQFEVCPKSNQTHLHTVITESRDSSQRMLYGDAIDGLQKYFDDCFKFPKYRTICVRRIHNNDGWLSYIEKTISK